MVLVSQDGKERLHAGRERLARVKIEVGKVNLFRIGGGLGLIEIEIDRAVIRETQKHGLKAIVLEDLREVLEGFDKLSGKTSPEMSRSDLLKLL
jgi:malic enzyme